MRTALFTGIPIAIAIAIGGTASADPVGLANNADGNGVLDVQKLTCAQPADTYQEDANANLSWYNGWYNGLAHEHYSDIRKGREIERLVIEYCKTNRDRTVIHAMAVAFREERAGEGVDRE